MPARASRLTRSTMNCRLVKNSRAKLLNKLRSISLHVRRKLPSSTVVRKVEMRSMSSGGSRSMSGAVAMVDDVGVGAVRLNGRKELIYQPRRSQGYANRTRDCLLCRLTNSLERHSSRTSSRQKPRSAKLGHAPHSFTGVTLRRVRQSIKHPCPRLHLASFPMQR